MKQAKSPIAYGRPCLQVGLKFHYFPTDMCWLAQLNIKIYTTSYLCVIQHLLVYCQQEIPWTDAGGTPQDILTQQI